MLAIATLETQARNHGRFIGKLPPLLPSVSLQGVPADIIPDDTDPLTWSFSVVRSGNRASDASVGWAVAPAGSAIPASAIVGGVYPSGLATIPAGETSVACSFQTAAGGQPSADQYATLALTGPSGCTLGNPVS
ncbi:MAG TPA: hypothetical protein VGR74_14690, partial [Actinomycetota bacterium]|nr:hypothetical protein [Actinomycetota bacterium]